MPYLLSHRQEIEVDDTLPRVPQLLLAVSEEVERRAELAAAHGADPDTRAAWEAVQHNVARDMGRSVTDNELDPALHGTQGYDLPDGTALVVSCYG